MRKNRKSTKKKWITTEFSFLVAHACRAESRLLRFASDRKRCRERIRRAVLESKAAVLNYLVASDHLRMAIAGDSAQVSGIMRAIISPTAAEYARRTSREGPFWKRRYNTVLVENGIHLLRVCLLMDRIMIDREVCLYPGQWPFSGYQEITGVRKRYRIVDPEKTAELTGFENMQSLRQWYLDDSDTQRFIETARQDLVDKALAVGGREKLERIGECFTSITAWNIELIVPDDKNPSYGLFAPKRTKVEFTRSLKDN